MRWTVIYVFSMFAVFCAVPFAITAVEHFNKQFEHYLNSTPCGEKE